MLVEVLMLKVEKFLYHGGIFGWESFILIVHEWVDVSLHVNFICIVLCFAASLN